MGIDRAVSKLFRPMVNVADFGTFGHESPSYWVIDARYAGRLGWYRERSRPSVIFLSNQENAFAIFLDSCNRFKRARAFVPAQVNQHHNSKTDGVPPPGEVLRAAARQVLPIWYRERQQSRSAPPPAIFPLSQGNIPATAASIQSAIPTGIHCPNPFCLLVRF